jgi:hypothetical protein
VRNPDATGAPGLGGVDVAVDLAGVLVVKTQAAEAYGTQIGFQFRGREHVAPVLTDLARREGHGRPVEVLRAGATARALIGTLEP